MDRTFSFTKSSEGKEHAYRYGYHQADDDAGSYGAGGLLVMAVGEDGGVLEGAVGWTKLVQAMGAILGGGRTANKGELDAAEDGVEVEVGDVEGGLEAVDVDIEGLWVVRRHCAAD